MRASLPLASIVGSVALAGLGIGLAVHRRATVRRRDAEETEDLRRARAERRLDFLRNRVALIEHQVGKLSADTLVSKAAADLKTAQDAYDRAAMLRGAADKWMGA